MAQTVDGDYGRIETRQAAVVHDVAWLAERHGFPGLRAVGKVEATREIDGEATTAWVLDVFTDEDHSCARKDHGPRISPDCAVSR